ncbi:MAG TPA: hypothetical protein VID47_12435 [Actinomycetota bacterium]
MSGGSATRKPGEPRWPASLAVGAALLLYFLLPESISFGPRWLIPALEAVVVIPLTIVAPRRDSEEQRVARMASLILLGIVLAGVGASLILLVRGVIAGELKTGGPLIRSGAVLWLNTVVGFGLLYWELDRGGPAVRGQPGDGRPDFLFPQMGTHEIGQQDWVPTFVDYLFLSFTDSTAFSPTDTLPLTSRAKLLMMLEALAAISIVVMVVGRAVNVLG